MKNQEFSFSVDVKPDREAFRNCILRKGTPRRVHPAEFMIDWEIQEEVGQWLGVTDGLDRADPHFGQKFSIAVQRGLGYDYVNCSVAGVNFDVGRMNTQDTADRPHQGGRWYVDEHVGPIKDWETFEKYKWPTPAEFDTRALEWYEKNLPDDMCVIATGLAQYYEHVSFLLGYETLCEAIYEQYDLLKAISKKLDETYTAVARTLMQFKRVEFVFGSDDMGFRNGLFLRPEHLRELVLFGHRNVAKIVHDGGKIYLHHNCGKTELIMEDLINDVKIDGKHSFEDTIEFVWDAKKKYGDRIAIIGGVDVDLLCRAKEETIRARVRECLDGCHSGGGYCLGSGNTVANYVSVGNYLTMLDEGRRYAA
jgi:uroporphyrinogen decarboxylase